MPKQSSIASLTVATNAVASLPKQLDSLLSQTRMPDEIIVVDNGSNDGTVAMIRDQYPTVTVIQLGDNLGVGGGFARGINYAALQKNHDWVWLLDDDSVPSVDALGQLLYGSVLAEDQGRKAGVVASIAVEPGADSCLGLLWRDRLVTPPKHFSKERIWFVDATISSGSMIRREAVEAAGLPRDDFFMDFVDFEYCLRIRRHGYTIAIVRDSVLHHRLGTPRRYHLFGERAWSDHAPWREYYIIRNHCYVVWHLYPNWKAKFFMVARVLRHGTAVLFLGGNKKDGIRMVLRGFLDGRRGRLGKRFLPEPSDEATVSFATNFKPGIQGE